MMRALIADNEAHISVGASPYRKVDQMNRTPKPTNTPSPRRHRFKRRVAALAAAASMLGLAGFATMHTQSSFANEVSPQADLDYRVGDGRSSGGGGANRGPGEPINRGPLLGPPASTIYITNTAEVPVVVTQFTVDGRNMGGVTVGVNGTIQTRQVTDGADIQMTVETTDGQARGSIRFRAVARTLDGATVDRHTVYIDDPFPGVLSMRDVPRTP